MANFSVLLSNDKSMPGVTCAFGLVFHYKNGGQYSTHLSHNWIHKPGCLKRQRGSFTIWGFPNELWFHSSTLLIGILMFCYAQILTMKQRACFLIHGGVELIWCMWCTGRSRISGVLILISVWAQTQPNIKLGLMLGWACCVVLLLVVWDVSGS